MKTPERRGVGLVNVLLANWPLQRRAWLVTPRPREGSPTMTAPLHDAAAETAPIDPALAGHGQDAKSIEGRSLGRIAWNRLKRDKVALIGGGVVLLLIVVAVCAPLIVSLLGHPPDQHHEDAIDPLFQTPKGTLGGISPDHLL